MKLLISALLIGINIAWSNSNITQLIYKELKKTGRNSSLYQVISYKSISSSSRVYFVESEFEDCSVLIGEHYQVEFKCEIKTGNPEIISSIWKVANDKLNITPYTYNLIPESAYRYSLRPKKSGIGVEYSVFVENAEISIY